MPVKLTLDQFCAQWVPKDARVNAAIPNRMAIRVHNFTIQAGDYAKTSFQGSFAKGGFCGRTTWAPRTSRWGTKKFLHPVMFDHGLLKEGIVGNKTSKESGTWRWPQNGVGRYGATRGFRRSYTYDINTTEIAFPERGKRGPVTRSRYNYAAIHNTPPGISPYSVNQHSSRKPVQRQFIGHDSGVISYINGELLPKIFDNLLNSYD